MPGDPMAIKAERLNRLIDQWSRRADRLIADKVSAARDHALAALTGTLKNAPDGRDTARKVRNSPSRDAAHARLAELLDRLAGPSVVSNEGLIRDAREAFWVESAAAWRSLVPDPFRRPGWTGPSAADLSQARRLVVHGFELRQWVAGPVARARHRLDATLTAAGRSDRPRGDAARLVETWARQTRRAIAANVRLALGDSAVAIDPLAGQSLVVTSILG